MTVYASYTFLNDSSFIDMQTYSSYRCERRESLSVSEAWDACMELYSPVFHVSRCMGATMFGIGLRLSKFSGVVLSCFTLSRSIIFADVSLIQTGNSIVQGNSLFSIKGQETYVCVCVCVCV